MSSIEKISFQEIVRPLRTTFATALGVKQHLRNAIVKITLGDGSIGIGEVPTSFAFRNESIDIIKSILYSTAVSLKGTRIDDYPERIKKFRITYPHAPMTVSGLEVALFRASLSSHGLSEHVYWGGMLHQLETNITIPFLTDTEALRTWVRFAASKGFTTYKLKVSGDAQQDKEIIDVLCTLLESSVADFNLRLDGNQGYSVESYLSFIDYLEKKGYRIELFEQPLKKDDYKGLAFVKKRSPVPVILDESVFTAKDAQRAVDNDLCHGINIKIAKSGISESGAILDLARRAGLKLMIGCMTETMVGLSAAFFLAAGSAVFDYIDLDSVRFLYGRNQFAGVRMEGARLIASTL